MDSSFGPIKRMINEGLREQAFDALSAQLKTDPINESAWGLMAGLVDDLDKKADCDEHILQIDPDVIQASKNLQALQRALQSNSREFKTEEATRCPTCGGDFEIHFIGELKDKWAVCPYCSTKIDIVDTFQRVHTIREENERDGRTTTVETTVIETRSDGDNLPNIHVINDPELEIRETLNKHTSFAIHRISNGNSWLDTLFPEGMANPENQDNILTFIKNIVTEDDLTDEELYRLLAQAKEDGSLITNGTDNFHILETIPMEERINCPHCEAVISKYASRCDWCSKEIEI